MDNTQGFNDLNQQLTDTGESQSISSAPAPEPKKSKQGITKKALILSIIFTLLLTACITSVIWFFLTQNNKPKSTPAPSTPEVSQVDDSTSEEKEVELTDATIKERLNYIFGAIHNRYDSDFINDAGKSVKAGFFMNYVSSLYENGEYNDLQKLWTTLFALKNDNEFLNLAYFSQLQDKDFSPFFRLISNNDDFRQYVTAVSAEKVEAKYKNLFGGNPIHQNAIEICGGFRYDADAGVYYYGQDNGCGGIDMRTLELYRTKYTTDGDNAYIYANAATTMGDTDKCVIYNDVFPNTYDQTNNSFITNVDEYYGECHISQSTPTAAPTIDFDLTTANLSDFAEYRYVFVKSSDGSYYFDSVEKL